MPEAPAVRGLTEQAVRALAEQWYAALDRHDGLDEMKQFVVDEGLEMRFPEGTFRGHAGFAEWYAAVSYRFFDERHTVTDTQVVIDGAEARVHVHVNWQARTWRPPAARSEWLGFDADQTWVVATGRRSWAPLIKTYICNALEPMPGSAAL
ncbi:nuclear transport factor 2 family protein [Streptomyces sp. NPDC048506]|uniref:nuclear transport factor 2 family protein n=1 Tax=Streptomyces sp. NPDC048506 TaxID=3155028 RepID=UPI00341CD843